MPYPSAQLPVELMELLCKLNLMAKSVSQDKNINFFEQIVAKADMNKEELICFIGIWDHPNQTLLWTSVVLACLVSLTPFSSHSSQISFPESHLLCYVYVHMCTCVTVCVCACVYNVRCLPLSYHITYRDRVFD